MIRSSFLISSIALAAAWLACAQTVLAQPVLTASDLPQGGQTYLRATAVPPLFSDGLEDSGAGLTWDFSDLASTGDQETEYFPMSEAGFTTQFIFSSADHFTAFELPDLGLETGIPISGATVYQEFGGSAYKTIGLGITTDFIDLPVIYEDEEELLPLPLTFGATLEGSSAFEVELPELLYYSTSQTAEIEVDAWGTLLLPSGSYECLRVKRSFVAQDSVNVPAADLGFSLPREGTVYEWYAAGEGMPVLSVQVLVGVPGIWQFKPEAAGPSGLSEPTVFAVQATPNPAAVGTRIALQHGVNAPVSVRVHDAAGRLVFSGILETNNGTTFLPSESWETGAYSAAVEGQLPVRFILR